MSRQLVTPQRARELLDPASRRKCSRFNVIKLLCLAHDMRNGQWQPTPSDPVSIDSLGVVDGRHRLTAVLLLQRPVEFYITEERNNGEESECV